MDFPKRAWLVSRIWVDPFQNERMNAVGYKPYGIAFSEDGARAICDLGRRYNNYDCWAIMLEMPEFKYEELQVII